MLIIAAVLRAKEFLSIDTEKTKNTLAGRNVIAISAFISESLRNLIK